VVFVIEHQERAEDRGVMANDESQGTIGSANREETRARKRGLKLFWLLAVAVPLIAVLYRVFEVYHR